MKTIALYIVSFLFIFALQGKTIDYLLKNISEKNTSISDDFCCDEENKEEKKSEEENENENIMDKLFAYSENPFFNSEYIPSQFLENNNFYFSEYYKIIYSPPEFA